LKPDPRFLNQPKNFWAHVRLIGQEVGYTDRRTREIKIPTLQEIESCLPALGLRMDGISSGEDTLTELGITLFNYFRFRADLMLSAVEPLLMNAAEARRSFQSLRAKLKPRCPLPMNKQKGKKRKPAYLTGIINMLIEANSEGLPCDYDPHELTVVTRDGSPLRTLARRVDGAFPSAVNPIAIWEVKEYYYTTTFGSRVADGVYESLLDGMELEELRRVERVHVKHYLMVDAKFTWWDCGKSYLCRLIDMLHMGYVDEILFGKEVVEGVPRLTKEWVAIAKQ
jgi:hypothetical protein